MKYDPNRNSKVIIPLAIVAWLGGILVSREGVPAVLESACDPGYTGKFIEMEVGDPAVFFQLPAAILGEYLALPQGLSTPV